MRLVVMTVSDRCSQGLMQDTAGPAVAALLRQGWPHAQIDAELLADDEDAIAARLQMLCGEHADLVLTVGGTGLSPRDRTPEATLRVLRRQAPGLAEAMRAQGAAGNPYAWLSRGVAGLRDSTLIVNLPGSLRGAVDSVQVLLPLLRHGLDVIAGGQDHPRD